MENFLKTVSALNDETRVTLLKFIDKNGATCVCDLELTFNMTQSRISRHLKILKDAGFLTVKRDGRWAHYDIRSPLDKFRQNALEEISYLDIVLPQMKENCQRSN